MKYDGGKNGSGVYQRLICMMPPHELYVEAFAGSAAILRRKRPARRSIAFELDRATIWELKDHIPADLFEPWAINSEWTGPAADLPGDGGTSIGFNEPGTDRANLYIVNADGFAALEAKFTAGAYIYGLHDPADVLVYMDPPYPAAVRSSPGNLYQFEMLSEQEHSDLCDLALSMPCRVMISGYDNDLYNRKLKGWRTERIPTVNRAGARVVETVWLNFPPAATLHDPAHVGLNYRERWNITKRVRNWTGQLQKMPAGTRQAIFEALGDELDAVTAIARAGDVAAMAAIGRKAAAANKIRKPRQRRTRRYSGRTTVI